MIESCEGMGNGAFIPRLADRSRHEVAGDRQAPRNQLSTKDSIAACAFLLSYVAAYLGIGFAGMLVVERVWLAIFR